MPLNFFQRRKILKNLNFLDIIPVRLHKHIINGDSNVVLIVPKFSNKKIGKFCVPQNKSENFNIKLDEIGSATWLEIDGKRKVKDICNILTEKFGGKINPAEERVTKFMAQLYEQRYISFVELQKE
jgi:hypothetical protein